MTHAGVAMDTEGYVLVEQLMALPQLKEFSLQDLLHGLSYECVRACLHLCVCVCVFVRGVCMFARARAYENKSFEFVDKMPHTQQDRRKHDKSPTNPWKREVQN